MDTQIAIKQNQLQSWSTIIKNCKESGMTVPEFCSQNGISRHAYYYWYSKVKQETYKQSFVEISSSEKQVPAVNPVPAESACSFEIHIENISFTIPDSVSKETLTKIIEVVRNVK